MGCTWLWAFSAAAWEETEKKTERVPWNRGERWYVLFFWNLSWIPSFFFLGMFFFCKAISFSSVSNPGLGALKDSTRSFLEEKTREKHHGHERNWSWRLRFGETFAPFKKDITLTQYIKEVEQLRRRKEVNFWRHHLKEWSMIFSCIFVGFLECVFASLCSHDQTNRWPTLCILTLQRPVYEKRLSRCFPPTCIILFPGNLLKA